MEENHDEIAAIFEAELRDLDIHDPNEDEYEASLAQIDALGAQLRETLNRSEENDDDAEWQNMMNMRKANARFQILEEALTGEWASGEKKEVPSSPKNVTKDSKGKRKVTSRSPSRSPSPKRSHSPTLASSPKKDQTSKSTVSKFPVSEIKDSEEGMEKEKKKEKEMDVKIEEEGEEKGIEVEVEGAIAPNGSNNDLDGSMTETEVSLSAVAPSEQSGIETDPGEIIRDLMNTIVDAVSSVAAMSFRPVEEHTGPITVDMSHLPKLFTSDQEAEHEKRQVRFASTIDKEVYEERALILDEAANANEKAKVQAAMDLLRMAEEKIVEEEEEERRLLEKDREQRLRRKQRMAEELLRAKRDKAATIINALARAILAKAAYARIKALRAEEERLLALAVEKENERNRQLAREEEERKEALRKEEEHRKFVVAENKKARQECEHMLDADLEMMAFVNEERMQTEREIGFMALEEASGLFLSMDPGGTFESQQEKIKQAWIERNVEEDPKDWAVYEDGEDIAEEEEEEEENEADFHVQVDSNRSKEGEIYSSVPHEKSLGSVDEPGVEVKVERAVPAAPTALIGPPSSRSAWKAFQRAHADQDRAGNCVSSDQYRRSLVSTCMAQATMGPSFHETGVIEARQGLNPIHPHTLRSSPPPADQAPMRAAASPRAKMGIRLTASARPSSRVQAENMSVGPWREVTQASCVFTQKPINGLYGAIEDIPVEGLPDYIPLEEGSPDLKGPGVDKVGNISCPLTISLIAWRTWHAYVEQSIDEARARFAAESEMESKYSLSTTLVGDSPALDEDEQEVLNALDLRRDPSKVTTLELKVEGLSSVSFLRVYPHITTLNLNVNRLQSLDGLQYLRGLEHLEAKDNAIVDISSLSNSAALRSVSLDDNKVADLSALSNHQGLQRLTINNNNLKTLESLVGHNFPRLQRLEAYQNVLSSVPEGALRGMSSLTYLDLGRNRLEWISGDTLSQCIHLQTLVLSQNRLKELPAPLRLPFLQVLWLSNNQLKSLDQWAPCGSAMKSCTSEVNASSITPTAPFPLLCPMLEKLYLQDNLIQEVHECAFLLCTALSEVDLSFNGIASPESLIGLTVCPELRLLQLQENPVTTSSAVGTRDGLLKWLIINLPKIAQFGDVDLSNGEVRAHFASAITEARMAIAVSRSGMQENGHPLEGTPAHERINHYIRLHTSSSSHAQSGSPFDPNLFELLSLMRLELNAVRTREKLRKRQIDVAVKGGVSREEAVATIGPTEESHAEGLLETYSKRLLAWPSLPSGWLPTVKLTDRLDAVQDNELQELREWEGTLSDRCRGKNELQKRHFSVLMVQALVRGFISRRRLARVLVASEYKDDELDYLVSGTRPPPAMGGGGGGEENGLAVGNDDFEEFFDLDEFLTDGINVPELEQQYFTHAKHRPKPDPSSVGNGDGNGTGVDKTSFEEAESASMPLPMVYGDHRSHKKAQRLLQESQKHWKGKEVAATEAYSSVVASDLEGINDRKATSADSVESMKLEGADLPSPAGADSSQRMETPSNARPMFAPGTASSSLQPASWADNGVHLKPINKDQASLADGLHGASPDGRSQRRGDSIQSPSYIDDGYEHDMDRPTSAMTDSSEPGGLGETPRSRLGAAEASFMSYADMAVNSGSASFNKPAGQSRKQHQQQEQLAQEWGIKDPRVLALMVKRSRKLQQSQGGGGTNSTRSSAKVASGMSAKVKSGGSGSFGGKPKTMKGTNRTGGRKGVPPAWAYPG